MRYSLKSFIQCALFHEGLWIEQGVAAVELKSLMLRLRPLDNSRGLIRIGPDGDGGYLLPDDLDDVAALISPGVSEECRFDYEIAERGIDVYMADASVDGPNISHPRFHFEKKYFGHRVDELNVTIDNFCENIDQGQSKDLIMQMDIEGAEYSIINGMSADLLKRFRIIVVEFHALNQLFARSSFQLMKVAFEKLLENHSVVHIHPNNCLPLVRAGGFEIPPVMEFTFYRNDRAKFSVNRQRRFPDLLDADCVATLPAITLPRCWRPD